MSNSLHQIKAILAKKSSQPNLKKTDSWRQRNTEFGKGEALEKASPKVPNKHIRALAESYAKAKGLSVSHDLPMAAVDQEHASNIAAAYHNMIHNPNHPDTKRAYDALIGETTDQLNHLQTNGYRFSKIKPGQENPYKNSQDLLNDLNGNKHVWYFPSETGFGSEKHHEDHPLLKPVQTAKGETMPANDAFRIVHDVFGHGKEGHGFGPTGEENAWQHHVQMYSPEAKKALTAETRGQNSWVNFGPHAAHNKANPAQTIYAPQKAGLLPEWAHGPAPAKPTPTEASSPAGSGLVGQIKKALANQTSLKKSDKLTEKSALTKASVSQIMKKIAAEAEPTMDSQIDKVKARYPEKKKPSFDEQISNIKIKYKGSLKKTLFNKFKTGSLFPMVSVVGVMDNGSLLMGKRLDNGKYTFPAGHANPGENAKDAAVRELYEEAGIQADYMHPMGNKIVRGQDGNLMDIHVFVCRARHTQAHGKNDPDQEVGLWESIPIQRGRLPSEVEANLNIPIDGNVLLQMMKDSK